MQAEAQRAEPMPALRHGHRNKKIDAKTPFRLRRTELSKALSLGHPLKQRELGFERA